MIIQKCLTWIFPKTEASRAKAYFTVSSRLFAQYHLSVHEILYLERHTRSHGKTEKNDKPVHVGRRISLEHEFHCTEIIKVLYASEQKKKNKIVAIPVSNIQRNTARGNS